MKVMAVVPTCRSFKVPEQSIPVEWIVVHDRELRPVEGEAIHIVAPPAERFGSRCSCIRSAGFLRAYEEGATHILTCDDDVLVPINWADEHTRILNSGVHPWTNTGPEDGPRMRGMPYTAPTSWVAITHGLWANVPDLDARTQSSLPYCRIFPSGEWSRIHPPFPLSSMNFGFRREVIDVMYQPAMGEGWPYKRHDDIWLGLFAERLLEHHGWAFQNGGAVVWHTRASDVRANLIAERDGAEEHEHFWRWIWAFDNFGPSLRESYRRLAAHVEDYAPQTDTDYFHFLADNMRWWLDQVDPCA